MKGKSGIVWPTFDRADLLSLGLWGVITLLVSQSICFAENVPAFNGPQRRHYELVTRVRDCHIYQAVLKKTKISLERLGQDVLEVIESVKASRSEFESCAKENGFLDLTREEDEQLAADTCLETYEAWLRRGMGLEIARQDLQSTNSDFSHLMNLVRYECPVQTVAMKN